MSPRRISVHVLAVTALSSLILPSVAAQDAPSTQPITISPTPAPTCKLDAIPVTALQGKIGATIERDASGATWIDYFVLRDEGAAKAYEVTAYRGDVPLDFYLSGKKVKPPKGTYWQYSGRPARTKLVLYFPPDAKWDRALRSAGTLTVRHKKAEVAAMPLVGFKDAMPIEGPCPEITRTGNYATKTEASLGPNRPSPILREPLAALCEFSATDAKAVKALRIGGTARERKNMTLRLVGPFNGPIDANGYFWLPEDKGMQFLVDGNVFALPDDAIMGRSDGANLAQVAVTFSDSDPLFTALKKAKTVAVRVGKSEVYRYTLPKKHSLFADSAACFQVERDAIMANATPRRALSPKGNPGTWVPQSAYPRRALRDGVQGTVSFTLQVDKYGFVEECMVTASSGDPDLDAAACNNLMKRARFNPKVDANGQLQRSTYANRVRWVIPQ